jgi:4-alpha-glucanotransferase
LKTRRSGILLHLSSLPSPFGIGDLGPGARRFADFLAAAGQTVWQVLPLNPTAPIYGNSPYSGPSAFAGSPLLVSPELMEQDGLLDSEDLRDYPSLGEDRVPYAGVAEQKERLLRLAYERFRAVRSGHGHYEFESFCTVNDHWLNDYALFVALKERFCGVAWCDWAVEIRDRAESAVEYWQGELADRIAMEKFIQFVFFSQWMDLKRYCNGLNIQIIGDAPIYVSYDSADVWSNPGLFKLDDHKRSYVVAGVPPDYFSETGQLWGNPIYNWDSLASTRYTWWVKRLGFYMKLYDLIRLDHFRGFVGYWEVPASEKTAVNGKWVKAPAHQFFSVLLRRFPYLPIIAEDLGIITADVREVMVRFGFPGMKVLLFAFGDVAHNHYAPHHHVRDCVVYTGTHDNNTARGWFLNEARDDEKRCLFQYLGRTITDDSVAWEMTRLAMMSVANLAVVPMQDVLGLGQEARMNMPSITYGNWEWRMKAGALSPAAASRLLELSRLYNRA